jgi:hypothetical protein
MKCVVPSLFFLLCSLFAWAPSGAQAQKPDEIGGNGKWAAYSFKDGGKKVCYMASAPTKQQGKYKQRGQPYALVTNRPATKSRGEVNFVAGYKFKKGAPVKVVVNKQKFELFSTDDRAWSPDVAMDDSLVKAMVRGSKMVVLGVSSRGTKTTDTYSLSGFTATKKLIDRACEIKK